jgi:hypothetical protein
MDIRHCDNTLSAGFDIRARQRSAIVGYPLDEVHYLPLGKAIIEPPHFPKTFWF